MKSKHPIPNPELMKAIEFFGSQYALAEALGIPRQNVHRWKKRLRNVPVIHALTIEKMTNGQIKADRLNPECQEFRNKFKKLVD